MPSTKTLAAAAMTAAIAGGTLLGATLATPFASGAQDNTETTTEASESRPEGRGHRGGVDLSVAAETLGLSEDELRTQLRDGSTLAEVAEAQGVDTQTLIDALVAAAETRLDQVRAELPERMAELVDTTLPAGSRGHHGRDGHGMRDRRPGLDAAAEALGITADELHEALRDGQTIAEVAEAKGVDVQAVIDAMVAEAAEHLAERVADGDITQDAADAKLAELTERITERVDDGRPAGRGGN
jgi:urease gamma subunit